MPELVHRFAAMGTQVAVIIVADVGERARAELALRRVEALFVAHEMALSRFRPDSELMRLNRAAGKPFQASPLLFAVVHAALAAARATGGLFDPTILGGLIAAGYDRSFEQLPATAPGPVEAPPAPTFSWRDVRLDPARRTITLPVGCGLDLGGIAKGWTVDQAAALLAAFRGYAVDAGGDIRVGGLQDNGLTWTVGVEDPFAPDRDLLMLALTGRAVATSTTARRRWEVGGQLQHHLIDPRTGRPARSGVCSATVIATTTARAEVLAKAAVVAGPQAGIQLLTRQPDATGLIVTDEGRVERGAGLPEVTHAT